ncbi:type VI secretion system baseplate subunit TssF [Ectothiorhodospira lacustris]|uniref:type VI secretion system baseplate subunit TssF n=1 Tax=Ectothiorhodospira lacustris TaxID=2899127 RepID=UPI001EE8F6B0|nr:type VI secretion system baseplate subunit TssF [Ectothiorhodospira lacustris]MCG5499359.1 type VI secretion system baseplate subunit TssF [Ectothiorhodospira lacustris]
MQDSQDLFAPLTTPGAGLKGHFDEELLLLTEAAAEFARAYPHQAHALSLDDPRTRDPRVERLFQGMAFLAALIRQRLDEEQPDVCAGLLTRLRPEALRPYPACTVLQLAQQHRRRQAFTLSAGTLVQSPPVGAEQTCCRFRTLWPVTFQPVHLEAVEYRREGIKGGCLILDLALHEPHDPDQPLPTALDLHVPEDGDADMSLLDHLVTATDSVHLLEDPSQGIREMAFGDQAGIHPSYALWQYGVRPEFRETAFPGFNLLQDFFHFKDRFRFITLHLGQSWQLPRNTRRFRLGIVLGRRLPGSPSRYRHALRLHCVAAVNLFEQDAEPLVRDPRRAEYPLTVDNRRPESLQIYRVEQVQGMDSVTGQRRRYPLMFSETLPEVEQGGYEPLVHTDVTGHTRIRLGLDPAQAPRHETLSCQVLAHNGHYPHDHIAAGTPLEAVRDPGTGLSISALSRPGRLYPPPTRGDWRWTLIRQVSMQQGGLRSTEDLRQWLDMLDWTRDPLRQKLPTGILDLEAIPFTRWRRGALHVGQALTLAVDLAVFAGRAEAALLGQVLAFALSMQAPIHQGVRLRLKARPGGQDITWPALPDHPPIPQ